MRFHKEYDVFIAYHGSYENNGSKAYADKVYNYLNSKGIQCFYFPASCKDIYKANIIEVMKSRMFILVCTNGLHTKQGKIDNAQHYELSTEIDAFYAMTQIGNVTVKEAKVFACGEYIKGSESSLHELFANRTHFYYNGDDSVLEDLYSWITTHKGQNHSWNDSQITTEIRQVFATRASMNQSCHFDDLVASAKSIRAAGISNSELTSRINPGAIANCIQNGGTIELLFLDPDGEYTAFREKEEGLRPNRIKNITNVNIDEALFTRSNMGDKKNSIRLFTYDLLPRMNIIFVDDYLLLQYYANRIAGNQNPTFFIKRQKDSPIFSFCEQAYEFIKNKSTEMEYDDEIL